MKPLIARREQYEWQRPHILLTRRAALVFMPVAACTVHSRQGMRMSPGAYREYACPRAES